MWAAAEERLHCVIVLLRLEIPMFAGGSIRTDEPAFRHPHVGSKLLRFLFTGTLFFNRNES